MVFRNQKSNLQKRMLMKDDDDDDEGQCQAQ